MQMNAKQTLLAGAAALALIVFGALFWIAPVWQFDYSPAAYQPPALQAQAEFEPEAAQEQWPININTATAEELMRLPGIGKTKAEAILADRAANGPYAAPEDLTRVKGISQRMVQQWGSDITTGG